MSLESWRKEYYPVDAYKLTSRDDAVLIEASLLKWIGLQKENLAEHGLKKQHQFGPFYIENKLMSGINDCSLCTKYLYHCDECPLESCQVDSPYRITYNNDFNNLTPLIEALAKALDKELNYE